MSISGVLLGMVVGLLRGTPGLQRLPSLLLGLPLDRVEPVAVVMVAVAVAVAAAIRVVS